MNFRMLLAAIAFVGMTAGSALAQNAFTTGNVNMRAGPSTQYPRVTTVPNGSGVDVHGCTSGWAWCDTSWRGLRGWVSANYLQMMYNNRRVYVPEYGPRIGVPTITFQFGNYWDRWYRDRPWYRDRNRWDNRRPDRWQDSRPSRPPHVDRPRPPQVDRPRPPRPGAGTPPPRPPQIDRPRPPRPGAGTPPPRPPQVDRPRPPRPGAATPPPRPSRADRPRPSRPEAGNRGQSRPQQGERGRERPGDMRDRQQRGRQGGNCPGGRTAPNGACI